MGFHLAAVDQATDGTWAQAWVWGSIATALLLIALGFAAGMAVARRHAHGAASRLSTKQRRILAVGTASAAILGPLAAKYMLSANAWLTTCVAALVWFGLGFLVPLVQNKMAASTRSDEIGSSPAG